MHAGNPGFPRQGTTGGGLHRGKQTCRQEDDDDAEKNGASTAAPSSLPPSGRRRRYSLGCRAPVCLSCALQQHHHPAWTAAVGVAAGRPNRPTSSCLQPGLGENGIRPVHWPIHHRETRERGSNSSCRGADAADAPYFLVLLVAAPRMAGMAFPLHWGLPALLSAYSPLSGDYHNYRPAVGEKLRCSTEAGLQAGRQTRGRGVRARGFLRTPLVCMRDECANDGALSLFTTKRRPPLPSPIPEPKLFHLAASGIYSSSFPWCSEFAPWSLRHLSTPVVGIRRKRPRLLPIGSQNAVPAEFCSLNVKEPPIRRIPRALRAERGLTTL